jgi:hypothetical protein
MAHRLKVDISDDREISKRFFRHLTMLTGAAHCATELARSGAKFFNYRSQFDYFRACAENNQYLQWLVSIH